MDDQQIIELYWNRSESAITETAARYGRFCYHIAYRILANREDSDECVNDTYLRAWEVIPPTRPNIFSAFLGKITRNLALNRYAFQTAEKRGGSQIPLALEELGDCIPGGRAPEQVAQDRELAEALNRFLRELSAENRKIFLQRYWNLMPVKDIAITYGISQSNVKRELLEQGLVPIGQSVTCNGYTLTLESALSDGYRSFLKFRLTAPEGVDLDGARYNLEGLSQITHADGKEIEFSVEGGDEYSLPDRKDPDNTIAILYESSVVPQTDSAEKMKLGTVWNITITNIYEYAIREDNAEQYYDLRKEISGEWSFHFTFDENTLLGQEQEILEDPIYCLGKRILWERSFPVIVKITSYKIRAFGATLRFEMPLLGVWEGVEHGPVFIFLKDGTVVEGHLRAGFDRGDYWENNYEFPIPITPDDISYVQFSGGQKVFLTEEEK